MLLATVVVLLLYGILYLITGSPAITGALTYIGKTEAELDAFDPELMIILSYYLRVVGITYMSLGIAYIFIINFGFRKKEKWAWIAALIAIVGFSLPMLLMGTIIIGFDIDMIILMIVLIIQIVGLIMTYKSFFGTE
ncbi:MAG: hypothetical protein ACFFDX_14935 [Candidatus Odinarchaeota archaeon]